MQSKKGFTLIELLVVIAIIGVLSAVVMVAINPAERMKEAGDAGRKSDTGQVATAMEAYYTRYQAYPATVAALVTSGDLKRDPGTVTIAASGTESIAYADLQADVSAGCTGATPDAYWCYRTNTGASVIVCKGTGVAPTAPDCT